MTAETGSRVSPLAARAERLASVTSSSGGQLHLADMPFLTQVSVRLDPKSPVADEVGLALGVPLPLMPGTTTGTADLTVLWLGPEEWLVVGPPGAADDLQVRLASAVRGEHATVVDVSAQRTAILVSGERARDLLAHGCSLDLHPRELGSGRCASTLLARAQVVLVARDADAPQYWVFVRSTFAAYLADWLLDAAAEYTQM